MRPTTSASLCRVTLRLFKFKIKQQDEKWDAPPARRAILHLIWFKITLVAGGKTGEKITTIIFIA